VDCNKKCCRSVSITPWDRNDICEPQCKPICEASKAGCRATNGNVSIPIPPSVVNELEKACALGFDTAVKTVIAAYTGQTAFTPVGNAKRFNEAKQILIATGLVAANEFDGVDIKFCRLTGNSKGFTYDRDRICITDHFSDGTHLRELASTLAHEMFHVRQYRGRGTDNFKCEYSKQMGRNGLRQDRGMDMERDAYEFEDRADVVLGLYFGGYKSLFGAYRLTAGQHCKPQRQHAYITAPDGRLVAINECGKTTPVQFSLGTINASGWKVKGQFDGKHTVTWENGSTWVRPKWDGVAGQYIVTAGQHCKPFKQLPIISQSGAGWTLVNECGQTSAAEVLDDGTIRALGWNVTGHIDYTKAAIFWSNSTIWAK
jgi:hypothetical protein